MSELFDKFEFMRNFGSAHREMDEKHSLWHLLHRLDELSDYIKCVEAMRECLSDERITSEGLTNFRKYIETLYNDACFAEMKKDIIELKKKTYDIQSVTIGINVNERFEAVSMGLVSINNKPFKKSGIVSNFADAIASKNKIQSGTDWDGDMRYHLVEKEHTESVFKFIENLGGFMAVRNTPFVDGRIRSTLVNISQIIPEFIYYIRFAEFITRYSEKGFTFSAPELLNHADTSMDTRDAYNLKLALNSESMKDIVGNDLIFDKEHTIYILTGANRGGKTTITQAIGLMYVLAQGVRNVSDSGIFIRSVPKTACFSLTRRFQLLHSRKDIISQETPSRLFYRKRSERYTTLICTSWPPTQRSSAKMRKVPEYRHL